MIIFRQNIPISRQLFCRLTFTLHLSFQIPAPLPTMLVIGHSTIPFIIFTIRLWKFMSIQQRLFDFMIARIIVTWTWRVVHFKFVEPASARIETFAVGIVDHKRLVAWRNRGARGGDGLVFHQRLVWHVSFVHLGRILQEGYSYFLSADNFFLFTLSGSKIKLKFTQKGWNFVYPARKKNILWHIYCFYVKYVCHFFVLNNLRQLPGINNLIIFWLTMSYDYCLLGWTIGLCFCLDLVHFTRWSLFVKISELESIDVYSYTCTTGYANKFDQLFDMISMKNLRIDLATFLLIFFLWITISIFWYLYGGVAQVSGQTRKCPGRRPSVRADAQVSGQTRKCRGRRESVEADAHTYFSLKTRSRHHHCTTRFLSL